MDPVFFMMAILGCDDAGGACRQERLEPVRYESAAACEAAVPAALGRNTDLDYPVVAAACQRGGRGLAAGVPSPVAPRS